MRRVALAGAAAVVLIGAPVAAGTAVEGTDRARLVPPSGLELADYRDSGYALRLDGDEAEVRVEVWPLASAQRFALRRADPPIPPGAQPSGAVERLARKLVAGAHTRYEASSRILGWVGRNVRYELDRTLPQEAADVLARGNGFCTGIARLTVALLRAVDIPAREVPGWVVREQGGTGVSGYHRWVEIQYDDRGWVMSDPLVSHHFVPATYLRLAGETVTGEAAGLLLEREERLTAVDIYGAAGDGVRARRNDPRQRSAALQLTVRGAVGGGTARLSGGGRDRNQTLVDGKTVFVGLEPGRYRLRVESGDPGVAAVEKDLRFRGRVRAALHVELPARREESGTR